MPKKKATKIGRRYKHYKKTSVVPTWLAALIAAEHSYSAPSGQPQSDSLSVCKSPTNADDNDSPPDQHQSDTGVTPAPELHFNQFFTYTHNHDIIFEFKEFWAYLIKTSWLSIFSPLWV